MCHPLVAALGVGALNLGMNVYQGEADYAVAKYNARQQENEAIRTANKGVEEENAFRQQVLQEASTQRAQLAAQGVDVNVGSAANIQDDTTMLGNADAMRIRGNYADQVQSLQEQSRLTLLTGRHARKMGVVRGVVSGLTSGIGTYGALR